MTRVERLLWVLAILLDLWLLWLVWSYLKGIVTHV